MAIMKCSTHKKVTDETGQGNALADQTAKDTAYAKTGHMYVVDSTEKVRPHEIFGNTVESVRKIQDEATEQERKEWEEGKAKLDENTLCWTDLSQRERWMLPDAFVLPVVTMAHGPAHVNAKSICDLLDPVWCVKHSHLYPLIQATRYYLETGSGRAAH
ncbi:hypothetical protein NDU88_006500 [Pleurodeles waltl]|uniref:Uncharacterized protein n=1 Tax=Pleurodeles waltl TaxID=8319 RepID=A0AAV7UPW2_PLEWA|nr:hypothetical protein NDU88_006500 [Pleurodeles waltl]